MPAPDLTGDKRIGEQAIGLRDIRQVRAHLIQYRLGKRRVQDLLAQAIVLVLLQDIVGKGVIKMIQVTVIIDKKLCDPRCAVDRWHGLQGLLNLLGVFIQNFDRHGLGRNRRELKQCTERIAITQHENALIRGIADIGQHVGKRRWP